MTGEEQRAIVERFWASMAANDFRAVGEMRHDDYVLDWPQSGERIRGRANFVAINERYPAAGRWTIALLRLIADEGGVATEVTVSDGVRADRAVTYSELRDGRIVRQTEYWSNGVEAAPWRAKWVDRDDG